MRSCSIYFHLSFFRLLISIFTALCQAQNFPIQMIEKDFCPFVETVSFGSDIEIRCNETHLTFQETNNQKQIWKFANSTPFCNENQAQTVPVDQCGVTRFSSKFLQVALKSFEHNEKACAYCQINYKSILATIRVNPPVPAQHILYEFNITARGLKPHESFEILWAKRINHQFSHSINYWFLPSCIESRVTIREIRPDSIVFYVDDTAISRVEFILRRCRGACRTYPRCSKERYENEAASSYLNFQTVDSIEKISCDQDCLNGTIVPPKTTQISTTKTTTDIIRPTKNSTSYNLNVSSTPRKQPWYSTNLTISILVILGSLAFLVLTLFLCYSIVKLKRKQHVYGRTQTMDPEEEQ